MPRFYGPDLTTIRWMDKNDRALVMVMVNGIGANLTNDNKGRAKRRALRGEFNRNLSKGRLIDLRRQ